MAWLEININTSDRFIDEISDHLQQFGAEAITFKDNADTPIYEPSPEKIIYWPNTCVTALFKETLDIKPILEWAKIKKDGNIIEDFSCNLLKDRDWERVCLQDIKPLQMGKRLWICPSWETPPEPHAINLMLDPGLAFGTGAHQTTALCLEWLDQQIQGEEVVIDYGCGSGILGLAALKLGAKQIYAIDIDPQALLTTRENAKRNGITDASINCFLPEEASLLIQPAEILIANILLQPLKTLAPQFAQFVFPGGKILLSGILTSQLDEIRESYSPWFTFHQTTSRDEWACISGFRS